MKENIDEIDVNKLIFNPVHPQISVFADETASLGESNIVTYNFVCVPDLSTIIGPPNDHMAENANTISIVSNINLSSGIVGNNPSSKYMMVLTLLINRMLVTSL